ncbi:Putative antitoxin of toxin-antitoxin system, YdaS/YdaT [Sphingomonas laterariae]|uniref:Putative antitoxin of toxin-antitoxin system, YdaS/YdaT n=2 Tax=Edaphosphingomonas laterariae TaxID=861865 RepID=A0A239CL64_9SPHN|nr:Putative antitoxin of toxin-antitoxin system, YdaS/YdaT [Sphingomonas laterariae]
MARLCGRSQPTVWKWLQSSKRLPPDYVLKVEAATGISRHLLRPDIYPTGHEIEPRQGVVVCDPAAISQSVDTRWRALLMAAKAVIAAPSVAPFLRIAPYRPLVEAVEAIETEVGR